MQHYFNFAIMIVVSSMIMFTLMYLNTYELDHLFFSETRAYMAVLMGASMAIVMLIFMWGMYPSSRINLLIICLGLIGFSGSLYLVRNQQTVDDVSWMKAMIPHHSIAILTSTRADISDPRVQDLANRIIAAQQAEIDAMKNLIHDLENGIASDHSSSPLSYNGFQPNLSYAIHAQSFTPIQDSSFPATTCF